MELLKKSVGLSIINDILTNAYQDNSTLNFVDLYENNSAPDTRLPIKLNRLR